MDRDQLVAYLDDLLGVDEVQDIALNGLQVAGRPEIERIATGVSASAQLFSQAAEWGADVVLVHHGLLWRGDLQRLVGSFRERVRILLENELNLVAYHLPLDRHPAHGNAAVLVNPQGEPIGTRIGRYKLLQKIGEGGCGVVYMAEQEGRSAGGWPGQEQTRRPRKPPAP